MLENTLGALHDHKDELLVLISLGAVAVSLLTALLAPLMQMRIARLSAHTTTLLATRVRWIETVQSDIANLVALIERTAFLQKSIDEINAKLPTLSDSQQEDFNRMHREYEEKTFQRNMLSTLLGIKLDISPKKRHRLFLAMDELAKQTPGVTTENAKTETILMEIQKIIYEVLQEEWSWIEGQVGRSRQSRSIS